MSRREKLRVREMEDSSGVADLVSGDNIQTTMLGLNMRGAAWAVKTPAVARL